MKKKHSAVALKNVCSRIDRTYGLKSKTHEVNKPCMIVVMTRAGKYLKEGMLGGEKFTFKGSYVGKSGLLIFRFDPVVPAGYNFIEIGSDKLEDTLPSFNDELTRVLDSEINLYLDNYSEVYEEKEAKEIQERKIKSYGSSWGLF